MTLALLTAPSAQAQERWGTRRRRVQQQVEPGPERILCRVLPCLHATAVQEVVQRLQVVECLVAVVDNVEGGAGQPSKRQQHEGS